MFPYADVPFTSCDWTAGDLHKQVVEFHLTYPAKDGIVESAKGIGIFMVLSERDKLMRLIIDVTNVDWISKHIAQEQHPLFQQHAERIEKHPESDSGKEHQPKFRVCA